jgi:hypothetical protein
MTPQTRRHFLLSAIAATTALSLPAKAGGSSARPLFTKEQLRQAHEGALADLSDWILKKIHLDPTSNMALLGPTFDLGTYYGRIGAFRTRGEGFGDIYNVTDSNFSKSRILPAIDPLELHEINKRYYAILRKAFPQRKFVAKHFPGGNEVLEATETTAVHFDNACPIKQWISQFDDLLKPDNQPWGMMMSHASYDLREFPGIRDMPEPKVPDLLTEWIRQAMGLPENAKKIDIYSKLPASLNPYATGYLRHRGFKGAIVGDWYNMKAISALYRDLLLTSKILSGPDSSCLPDPADMVLLLTTFSGINYARGSGASVGLNQHFWKELKERKPEFFQAFNTKLNELILETYNQTKKPEDPVKTIQDVEKLSFEERVTILHPRPEFDNGFRPEKYKQLVAEEEASCADRDFYRVINIDNAVSANDLWDRSGLMTAQYRKSLLERLFNKKLAPDAPFKDIDEYDWLNGLKHKNKVYQKAYRLVFSDQTSVVSRFSPPPPATPSRKRGRGIFKLPPSGMEFR